MITSSIKNRVQTILGSDFNELSYSIDVSKNSFKGNEKRFGVLSKGFAEDVSGLNGYLNIEQDFELILTDLFINKSMSDSEQKAKTENLQDKIILIYKDLVKEKAGSPTCLLIRDLVVSPPEYLDKDNSVIVLRATFKVKYRTQI